jgi:hypothetical protein
MPSIKLSVPVVAQEKANCCWHTAAYMIWLYWQGQSGRAGPMNTVGPAYAIADDTPLQYAQYITLAQKVGLSSIPIKNEHSEADLCGYLTDLGPIWANGLWYGPGHCIVVTGVGGGKVFFNDPDRGVKKEETIKWFNEKLFTQWIGCLMVKDQARY